MGRTPFWVRDLRFFEPYDSKGGHWGRGQTGFNLSASVRILLSDGRKVKVDGSWVYPCHRDLIEGEGEDRTCYSGIYSYGFKEGTTLWLYPHTEEAMNDAMRRGLASLIGIHRINGSTPVRSNSGRHVRRWRQTGELTSTVMTEATPIRSTGSLMFGERGGHSWMRRSNSAMTAVCSSRAILWNTPQLSGI